MIELTPGTVLSQRYRLVERIGRGGMAEVWAGQDMTLGRQVAVKIMLPQFAMDPEFVQRFKREASAAANLSSPYIVNVYDWGQDDNIQYIIMEYVLGEDLKHLIQTKGVLSTTSAAKIGAQVCRALASAHHQDIVHRDVKPQNIMITQQGAVKVMDFGISRAKNSTDQKTQVVLGTAQYVSPEQAQGLELGAASDIYSLGIVLYESVTGKLPFNGEDAVSVALKQVEEPPVPPSHISRNVDSAFEAIILKALAKDPADRYESVQEMEIALDNYANGLRDMSNAATQAMNNNPRAGYPVTRAVAMPASAAVGVTPDGIPPSYTNAESGDEQQKSKKKRNIIIASVVGGVVLIAAIVTFLLLGMARATVPDVIGSDIAAASAAIEEAGLQVGEVSDVPSKDVPKGSVVSTDPEAGTEVEKNSKVDMQVSSGPALVKVPDITNMTEETAKAALESVGLKGQRGPDEFSADVPEGSVVKQSPSDGEEVEAGTVIIYSLSAGSDTVNVPDLSGMEEEAAIQLLETLGLKGLVGSRQASDTVPEGCVISQNPAKDLKLELGSQVTFTISTGVASVSVPALEGLTQTAARSTLINAGLELGTVTEEFSNEPRGTVIHQSQNEGSQIQKGSAVDIVVSKGPDPSTSNSNNNANAGNNNNVSTQSEE